jgi:hypothetical protein
LIKKTTAIHDQSVLDVSIQEHLSIEHAFEIAVSNDVSLTEDLTPGIKYLIPDSELENVSNHDYFIKQNYKVSTSKDRASLTTDNYYTVVNPYKELLTFVGFNQSTLDIAVQESGTIESVFEYLENENLSLTEYLVPGSQVKTTFELTEIDTKTYYKNRKLRPATGFFGDASVTNTLFEAGLFESGLFE